MNYPCPYKCGNEIHGSRHALSRVDNETAICSDCGMLEALNPRSAATKFLDVFPEKLDLVIKYLRRSERNDS